MSFTDVSIALGLSLIMRQITFADYCAWEALDFNLSEDSNFLDNHPLLKGTPLLTHFSTQNILPSTPSNGHSRILTSPKPRWNERDFCSAYHTRLPQLRPNLKKYLSSGRRIELHAQSAMPQSP